MHEKDTTEVMNLVFQYLTPPDLAIAAQVSSTWDRIAKHESLERNTYFYCMDKVIKNFLLRYILKNMNIKTHFNFVPSFGMRFYNSNIDVNINHESNCRNRQFSGLILNIKSNCNMGNLREIRFSDWFFFPINYFKDVTILSFINRSIANKNRCHSLNIDTDEIEKMSLFLSDLNGFFSPGKLQPDVLIILCRHTTYKKLVKAFKSLYKWFGHHFITIWLAVVDELSFCRYNFGQHDCRIDTEFIFMFINDPLLTAYVSYIYNDCSTAEKIRSELIMFKEEIELSLHSIAFMHVPYIRIIAGLYELDISIFKEVFPNVVLFPFYGTRSFFFSFFEEIFHLKNLPVVKNINQHTSILLLTHD